MNSSLLQYLVSPVSHQSLDLYGVFLREKCSQPAAFPIVEGVPVLLPDGYSAEWYGEVMEVLFRENTSEVLRSLAGLSEEDGHSVLKERIAEEYGAEGVLRAFRSYSGLPENERLRSFVRLDPSVQSTQFPALSNDALESHRKYVTLESGNERALQMRDTGRQWAVHLPDYVDAVFGNDPDIILELGTGAGLGTNALLERGLGSGRLVSLDIDYGCVGNAEGLAKVYGLESSVDVVVASYWYLPFREGSMDVVCTHYGIDESREFERVLSEVVRVLRPGGRFVGVGRVDPTVRLRGLVGDLGLGAAELAQLVASAHLYPGPDEVVKLAQQKGMTLEGVQVVSPEDSHERAIITLIKSDVYG